MHTCTEDRPRGSWACSHWRSNSKPARVLGTTLERYLPFSPSRATSSSALLTTTPSTYEMADSVQEQRLIRLAHPDTRGRRWPGGQRRLKTPFELQRRIRGAPQSLCRDQVPGGDTGSRLGLSSARGERETQYQGEDRRSRFGGHPRSPSPWLPSTGAAGDA